MTKITIVLFFLCSVSTAFAQADDSRFPLSPKETIQESQCGVKFNRVLGIAQHTSRDDLIIIVSHIGEREQSKFGERRLFNIKAFLTWDNLKDRRSPESIVVAQGEKVSSNGYLDFYIKGEIELRIMFQNNADLSLGDCAPERNEKSCSTAYDKLFYPCRSK